MSLSEMVELCNEVTERLKRRSRVIPRVTTCAYSRFPRSLWCDQRIKLVLQGDCATCSHYEPRKEGGNYGRR